ncbi:MAG: hypothetical protein ACON5H_12020 [Akkermansiaceae bacterium]
MKTSILLQKTTHYLGTSLTLVSQRLPFIQHFAPLLSSPASLRIATPLVTSFAGTHTLTGQTTMIMPVAGSENPLNLETGQEFKWEFDSARYGTGSSAVNGLPPEASYSFGYEIFFNGQGVPSGRGGTISGAINVPGTYQVTIVGFRRPNQGGNQTPPYSLTINVTDPVVELTPEELFEEWRELNWLGGDATNDAISGPNADPDNDEIPNILEYALDLDPNEAKRLETLDGHYFGRLPGDNVLLLWEIPYLGTANLIFESTEDPSDEQSWEHVPDSEFERTETTVRLVTPMNSTKRFYRLRASL